MNHEKPSGGLHRVNKIVQILCFGFLLSVATSAADRDAAADTFRLDSTDGLQPVNGTVEVTRYRGRKAVHLVPLPGHENSDQSMFAILSTLDRKDGTIEVDVAGAPRAGSAPNMRGFIGIAFRVQSEAGSELFYLRPTNARMDDQLVRNHSVQYVSDPDFSWQRLRKESPGVYEAYADLEAGAWTKMRIEVSGTKARLFVNGAAQPCLIVNDLKRGESRGHIALWAHSTTEAYFSNLKVR
jgi:hypothetical protein